MKPAEIRDLTPEEMTAKEAELSKELFNLKMRHATNQLENPLKLRIIKREIARVKTVIAEKGRSK
ncbi:MAG: 50S ribosomal protein L29 [Deltaproteobacteria bacterium GWC2_56_8]|nr:MAG: 50S ribosomal protein L29 [Deltaproteobacteria bacterium GWB2_55_19]OGP32857.1 MAG: 50S ribosomal protein L29 [Deltaproteobacteria bacterium GWC2_56_8]HAO92881.1 50S ribosomal protein L29 [Deltaproteobacteria bacterium]